MDLNVVFFFFFFCFFVYFPFVLVMFVSLYASRLTTFMGKSLSFCS